MFNLTIALKGTQTVWALMFKKKEDADKAWALITETLTFTDGSPMTLAEHGGKIATSTKIVIEDDFGQRFHSYSNNINGVVLEDMEQSKLAHIERGLHQSRTQVKYQQMFEADPVLKTYAMTRGPAMIQPMPGGNGRM